MSSSDAIVDADEDVDGVGADKDDEDVDAVGGDRTGKT